MGNLTVDADDPNPRPMIAVLDARPGLVDEFRVPDLSTGGPGSLIQLTEIPIAEPGTGTPAVHR